jgi:predicted RNase H-like HicB family nuclease
MTHSMLQEFHIIIEQDEEGLYVASVPALPGCHTQAPSLDALMERVKEAIEICAEKEHIDSGGNLRFVGVQRLTVDV